MSAVIEAETDADYEHFLFAEDDPFMNKNGTRKLPPKWYKDGPMPTISDSLFSLIILIYVGVIFLFMFFAFCWKEPEPEPPDPADHKDIPMITSILEEMARQDKLQFVKNANNEIMTVEMTELKRCTATADETSTILNVISEKKKS
jgi:hypothetical protein